MSSSVFTATAIRFLYEEGKCVLTHDQSGDKQTFTRLLSQIKRGFGLFPESRSYLPFQHVVQLIGTGESTNGIRMQVWSRSLTDLFRLGAENENTLSPAAHSWAAPIENHSCHPSIHPASNSTFSETPFITFSVRGFPYHRLSSIPAAADNLGSGQDAKGRCARD